MDMQRYVTSMLLLLTLTVASCRHAYEQTTLLTQAESRLPADVDAADSILSLVDRASLVSDDAIALHNLLLTMTDALHAAYRQPWSTVHGAYAYYHHHSHAGTTADSLLARRYTQAALYLGDWYAAHDSIKASEDCYRAVVLTAQRRADHHYHYVGLQRLAEQRQWSDYDEALALVKQAIAVCEAHPDTLTNLLALYDFTAHCSSNCAYAADADYTEALAYARKALTLAQQHGLTACERQAWLTLSRIAYKQGNAAEALRYAKHVQLDSVVTNYDISLARCLAESYLACDSLQQAKALLLRPSTIKSTTEGYLYARTLADIALREHDTEQARTYMEAALDSAEALFDNALQAKDDYFQSLLLSEQRQQALTYSARLRTIIWVSTIIVLTLLLSAIATIATIRLRTQRQHATDALRIKEQEKALLREQALKAESDKQLLLQQQAMTAEQSQQREAMVRYLQHYIVSNTDIGMKLKRGVTHSKLAVAEWVRIEQLLDEIDNQWFSRLKAAHPDFTTDDLRLCLLVRLGLSNTSIASIYCITPSAVQHRKLTLKKKGFCVTAPDVTLSQLLLQM